MAQNISQIPAPRVPLVDLQTNTVSREWFVWFNNVYSITGGGSGITQVINGTQKDVSPLVCFAETYTKTISTAPW